MDSWHATFLGLRHLPREVTAFEIEVFFQFSAEEARIIEERRRPELKLELALQIGRWAAMALRPALAPVVGLSSRCGVALRFTSAPRTLFNSAIVSASLKSSLCPGAT